MAKTARKRPPHAQTKTPHAPHAHRTKTQTNPRPTRAKHPQLEIAQTSQTPHTSARATGWGYPGPFAARSAPAPSRAPRTITRRTGHAGRPPGPGPPSPPPSARRHRCPRARGCSGLPGPARACRGCSGAGNGLGSGRAGCLVVLERVDPRGSGGAAAITAVGGELWYRPGGPSRVAPPAVP